MGQADLLGCDRLAISYGHYEGADIDGKFTTIFFCVLIQLRITTLKK